MGDDVLCIFEDGRAHGVGEIAKAVPLPESKVRKVAKRVEEIEGILKAGG